MKQKLLKFWEKIGSYDRSNNHTGPAGWIHYPPPPFVSWKYYKVTVIFDKMISEIHCTIKIFCIFYCGGTRHYKVNGLERMDGMTIEQKKKKKALREMVIWHDISKNRSWITVYYNLLIDYRKKKYWNRPSSKHNDGNELRHIIVW
jgi:hypothetical protein